MISYLYCTFFCERNLNSATRDTSSCMIHDVYMKERVQDKLTEKAVLYGNPSLKNRIRMRRGFVKGLVLYGVDGRGYGMHSMCEIEFVKAVKTFDVETGEISYRPRCDL